MAEGFFALLRGYFDQYGYWTVAVALLLENAGLPVPGETVLLFASFLAYSERELSLPWIIVVGTVAATLGDNLGYTLGRRGGRPLLERYKHWLHISEQGVERGERMFARYGAVAIFFARFLFGLRIIAGPLAGVLRMPWRRFLLFNFLGAVTWVSAIAVLGYLFGSQWQRLMYWLKGAELAVLALLVLVIVLVRMRRRSRRPPGASD
jgi:membrane-associated protein